MNFKQALKVEKNIRVINYNFIRLTKIRTTKPSNKTPSQISTRHIEKNSHHPIKSPKPKKVTPSIWSNLSKFESNTFISFDTQTEGAFGCLVGFPSVAIVCSMFSVIQAIALLRFWLALRLRPIVPKSFRLDLLFSPANT